MTTQGDILYDLMLEAGLSRSEAELFFHIVNRSVAVVQYDRASVWRAGRTPRLLAVSGTAKPDPKGAFAATWRDAFLCLKNPEQAGILEPARFPDAKAFTTAQEMTGGLSAWYQPLPGKGIFLLFERWGNATFSASDGAVLERLIKGYSLLQPISASARESGLPAWLWRVVCLLVIVLLLVLVRLPLRVVAECEVAPREPRIVTAPMDGVIQDVLVAPGQMVEAGTILAEYDTRLMEEDLNISRRQVEVVQAQLESAMARGFTDAGSRGDIALLEARLAQEEARLQAMTLRYGRRRVTAPVSGMVQLDDARAWRGRPVSTGQAVLWLVQPGDTRVDLRLPQDDRIDIDTEKSVSVHLHALGGEPHEARLLYISPFATAGADGQYAFPAEAEWLDSSFSPPLGLQGSAFLYGNDVSLGYWLLRRPLAWARRWLGV